jgi:hypothetical protein
MKMKTVLTWVLVIVVATVLVPVTTLLAHVLIGLVWAVAIAFVALLMALGLAVCVVVMPWLYFRGDVGVRAEVNNWLAEARRIWAEGPEFVVWRYTRLCSRGGPI